MTAVPVRAVLGLPSLAERTTSDGWGRTQDAGWSGSSTGTVILGRAAAEAGTVMRSIALGMLEAADPGWLKVAARYYEVLIEDVPGTGASTVLRRGVPRSALLRAAIRAPDQIIADIRATLGLNMSETARALGVERLTVYSWVSGQVQPQRANLLRLDRIAEIAASWRRRTHRSLGYLVRVPGEDGRSIAEMLADDMLPDRALAERLDAVAALDRPAGAKLRRRGVASVHEVAARHRLGTRPREGNATEIDWLTRPSFDDEDG